MISQGHINNGEVYMTPIGQEMIPKLIRAAFGKHTVYLPTHHLTFQTGNPVPQPEGSQNPLTNDGETYEMASLETFLFNHQVAFLLFGPDYRPVLSQLACVPEGERLQWLKDREHLWNK
jgi:hypothetical protein